MDATNSTLNMPQVLHCNMLLSSGARCLAGGCVALLKSLQPYIHTPLRASEDPVAAKTVDVTAHNCRSHNWRHESQCHGMSMPFCALEESLLSMTDPCMCTLTGPSFQVQGPADLGRATHLRRASPPAAAPARRARAPAA